MGASESRAALTSGLHHGSLADYDVRKEDLLSRFGAAASAHTTANATASTSTSTSACAVATGDRTSTPELPPIPFSTPLFRLHSARHKATFTLVSLFVARKADLDPDTKVPEPLEKAEKRRVLLLNAIHRLKTIRHPGIVKYKDSFEDDGKYVVVTEPVVPLWNMVQMLSQEEVALGIYNLLKTVQFLHSQGLAHNSITSDSIFIGAKDRRWLLASLENLSEYSQVNTITLEELGKRTPEPYIPPEDTDGSIGPVVPPARDVFSLSTAIEMVIAFAVKEECSESALDWADLEAFLHAIREEPPTTRPTITNILQHKFFTDSPLIYAVEVFLKNIRVFNSEQKEEGFRKLGDIITTLPVDVVVPYILPQVLSREMLVEPGSKYAYQKLFQERAFLSGDIRNLATRQGVYVQYVLPFVLEMIAIRDYDVRVAMLSLFEDYHLSFMTYYPKLISSLIIPELMLGLDDVSDNICLLSFKAACQSLPEYCRLYPANENSVLASFSKTISSDNSIAFDSTTSPTDLNGSSESTLSSDPNLRSSYLSLSSVPSALVPPSVDIPGLALNRWSAKSISERLLQLMLCACLPSNPLSRYQEEILSSVVVLGKSLCHSNMLFAANQQILDMVLQGITIALLTVTTEARRNIIDPVLRSIESGSLMWLSKLLEVFAPFTAREELEFRKAAELVMSSILSVMSSRNSARPSEVFAPADDTALRELQRVCSLPRETKAVLQRSGPRFDRGTATGVRTEKVPVLRVAVGAFSDAAGSAPAESPACIDSAVAVSPTEPPLKSGKQGHALLEVQEDDATAAYGTSAGTLHQRAQNLHHQERPKDDKPPAPLTSFDDVVRGSWSFDADAAASGWVDRWAAAASAVALTTDSTAADRVSAPTITTTLQPPTMLSSKSLQGGVGVGGSRRWDSDGRERGGGSAGVGGRNTFDGTKEAEERQEEESLASLIAAAAASTVSGVPVVARRALGGEKNRQRHGSEKRGAHWTDQSHSLREVDKDEEEEEETEGSHIPVSARLGRAATATTPTFSGSNIPVPVSWISRA
ncbi:hypothetical protein DFJ73DRAFT_810638 [Zopfochytrium polystomum]|nr:hypothetical protein DFJ73DRAFT_810638 [Zopfochytrium polystomum]